MWSGCGGSKIDNRETVGGFKCDMFDYRFHKKDRYLNVKDVLLLPIYIEWHLGQLELHPNLLLQLMLLLCTSRCTVKVPYNMSAESAPYIRGPHVPFIAQRQLVGDKH